MQKNLLTLVSAVALLLTAAQPAAAAIAGTHTLTATATWTNPANEAALSQYLGVPKTFTITESGSSFELGTDFLGNFGATITLKYDSASGQLTFQNSNLGSYLDFDTFTSYGFGIANIDGDYVANSPTVAFSVDDDDNITLPDFSIVNTSGGNTILVKYTNVKIDGNPADGGDDSNDPVEYPASVTGEYTFTGTVTYNPENSATYESLVKDYIPATFDFTIESAYFDNFVGYDGYLFYSYDKTSGTITITSNVLSTCSSWYPGEYMGVQLGLADANGTWPGLKNNGGDILKIQVDAEGNLSIPDFTIVDRNHGNPVIATYTNCTVTKAGEGGGGEGGNEGEVGDFVPTLPDLGEYSVVGTYDLTVKPTTDFTTSGTNVTLQAEVIQAADGTFYIKETEYTDYFNGTLVAFSYADGAQLATFEQYCAGTAGSQYVWIAPFINTPELQNSYGFTFTAENGFTFNGTVGLGWLYSTSETQPEYTGEVLSAYYLVDCTPVEEPASYPAPGEFDGNYIYECADFTLEDESYASTFKANVPFTIAYISNNLNVQNFLGLASVGTDYNQETGIITLNTNYWRDGTTWIGIAPVEGGGWKGLSGNKMQIKVGEDKSITIPDFDIVTFNGATVLSTIAKYRSGTVKEDDGTGGDEEEEKSFAGTYALVGTKYEYPAGTSGEAIESALNFNLVINDNNQITSIAGYTLSDEEISNNRNKGIAEGDQLVLEASFSAGVMWQQSTLGSGDNATNFTESWLLGGPDITGWDQSSADNKVVFTLDEDGNYSLAPFTLWHRYQKINESENTEWVYDLVFKWDDTPYAEFADPEIEGFWSIPLNDHYQGSSSLKEFTGKYAVTIEGESIKFASDDSDYDIVGEFVDATTISFSKALIVPATYALYQVPYLNTTETDEMGELDFQESITATYNAAEGTITFPENSGIAYGRFKNGELSYWDAAYDFTAPATKSGNFTPELTISNVSYQVGTSSISVTVDVAANHFSVNDVDSWKAEITEMFSDKEAERDWTEVTYVAATVENGVATFEIGGLSNGNHDITFALVAYAADNEVIATSNSRALSVVVGPNISIRNIQASATDIDENTETGSITVEFSATFSGFDAATATFKGRLTDNKATEDADPVYVAATVDEGNVTVLITDLAKGTYDYTIALVAYDGDEELAVSNNLQFVATVDDVTSVSDAIFDATGEVRFYDLRGVEIANPQPGNIVIRVSANGAEKVIIK